ncbi:MAG: RluA family pseudouridine synthase [Clostridia bacterium]|nr:RluA family pseudouridine synthase [Clostridia bacterium]
MLNVLYEDNHIIVVVKPQNIPSQADESQDKDMLTMVKEYVKEKYNKPNNVYIGLVHRLDRPTGGLMVFARTSKAAERLSKQIADRELQKYYLAVVEGSPKEKFTRLVHYLKKDEKNNKVSVVPKLETGAKEAELEYTTLSKYEDLLSLVKVQLFTGRSHQIRVQMSTIGNPIVSDIKYGAKQRICKDLSLWAYKIVFNHPVTKQVMQFSCYPPTENVPWKYFNLDILKL